MIFATKENRLMKCLRLRLDLYLGIVWIRAEQRMLAHPLAEENTQSKELLL
jgi:hypothetical protein